ncbi:hypothetical protein ACFO0N_11280 [Halobium salinum]|uniref:Regulatory protein FmdB Zinc ribbon domain-containing protein n=1 Tax=Halobium salinum TaxID=1364940 RepID=A0ABD5PCB2_9EURY|nr:hypothetical protein [Halobium salinum]
MSYRVDCPFCGCEIEVSAAYPYTDAGCPRCKARVRCERFNEALHAITQLPRDAPRGRISAVLEAGIHGDGVGVSAERITAAEVRGYGVNLGTDPED